MNKLKGIFNRIKSIFSNLLRKNDKPLISAGDEKLLGSMEENENLLEIYENVKNGLIPIESLMINDLIKIQTMLIEEGNIYDEKINERKNELVNLKSKKSKLINEKLELENV